MNTPSRSTWRKISEVCVYGFYLLGIVNTVLGMAGSNFGQISAGVLSLCLGWQVSHTNKLENMFFEVAGVADKVLHEAEDLDTKLKDAKKQIESLEKFNKELTERLRSNSSKTN